MNSTLTGAVATYLAQVRTKLSDLPPAEREDVLDDVASHLAEVAGEFEDEPTARQLEDRLGSPRQYADELRTAAGYPPRQQEEEKQTPSPDAAARSALRWAVVAVTVGPFFVLAGLLLNEPFPPVFGLVALFGAAYLGVRALRGNPPEIVLGTPVGRRWAERIQEPILQLPAAWRHEIVSTGQPIWWAVRGMVAGGGLFALAGVEVVTVVAALAGAVASIWIGRKSQQDRRWLWYLVPLNVVAAMVVPIWLALSFAYGPTFLGHSRGGAVSSPPAPGLAIDGQSIENVYPYDAQGKLLENIRLYDQNGQPIAITRHSCPSDQDDGQLTNVFPQPVVTYVPDSNGEYVCKESSEPPFVAPLASEPPSATRTTPSPSPGASTGPSGKPTPPPPAATSKPTTPGRTPGVTLTVVPSR